MVFVSSTLHWCLAVPDNFQIGVNHHLNKTLKGNLWLPSELVHCFCGISYQFVNFSWSDKAGILDDVIVPIKINISESNS